LAANNSPDEFSFFFSLWSVFIQIVISSELIIILNESQFYSAVLSMYRLMVRILQCFPDTSYVKFDLRMLAASSCTCNTVLLWPAVWCACPVWKFECASSALHFHKHTCRWKL